MRCAGVTESEYTRLTNSTESWICIACHRQDTRSRRVESRQVLEHTTSESDNHTSQEDYLRRGGWQTEGLHEQPWAQKYMNQFLS